MSANFPAIEEWERLGLKWMYIWNPKMAVTPIPAGGQVQVPYEGYAYKYPEGILLFFDAIFDHPSCGMRWAWGDPEVDSGTVFTVSNALLTELNLPELLAYARIPPDTPYYHIRICSSWIWKNWLKLYLINTDSISRRCLGFGYMLAVLTEPRKETK